jgi:hypothetical protein
MPNDIPAAYDRLASWCRGLDYSGYDPFDGLNSRIFRATPLYRSRLARLAWTQFFKRSPINFRGLSGVPRERNSKGTALFALAKLEDYRRTGSVTHAEEARALLDDLVRAQLPGFSGAAWGYNFDWQGRAFFAPRGTPTIVPTAFAARALLTGAEVLNDPAYLETAQSAGDFILNDLRRPVDTADEVCFSYTPGDDTRVYNASLLAGETLAAISCLTGNDAQADLALRAARYVTRRQREDGSWAYGEDSYQGWSDNFHTAFILSSLYRITQAIPGAREELMPAIRRGYDFWRESFFLADGWPKYFPDRLYPADAHSAGAAIVTFVDLRELDPSTVERAETVAHWAIRNLQSPQGFFYYQRHRFYTNRIPYMRWSQAWMAYALARLVNN